MGASTADSPFDDGHYAATLGRKLVRAAQLGPKYYLVDLPRYFALRGRLGLPRWDRGAVVAPVREFWSRPPAELSPPPGYADALRRLARAGVRLTMPPARLAALVGVWWSVRGVRGDVLECGSYRGATALLLAQLGSLHGVAQRVLALDTFAGAPATSGYDLGRQPGEFRPPPDQVARIQAQAGSLGVVDRIEVHAGLFAETFARLAARQPAFALVHVDANIYESTLEACRFAIPRVSRGGAVVFDDYHGVCDLGARLAIDAYRGAAAPPLRPLVGSSAYLRVP